MTLAAGKIEGLYAIIDSAYSRPADFAATAQKVISGGARIVQLRVGSGVTDAEFLRGARTVGEITRERGAIFIVNDRADIALLSGASGVHLGLSDISVPDARSLLGAGAVIGASTHDAAEARAAARAGADYVSLGPIYPTPTKKDAHTPRGLATLREVRRAVGVPIVAIGGITEAACANVIASGADSIAMISALLTAGDITARTASVVAAIAAARGQ